MVVLTKFKKCKLLVSYLEIEISKQLIIKYKPYCKHTKIRLGTSLEHNLEAQGRDNTEYPNQAYAWYTVSVLLLAYVFSYIDRSILTLLVDPIRETLMITDLELSLLHGFAFAMFYVILGIPIARYADSHNRVRLISLGIMIWCVMTAMCGFAKTFWHMFIARVGVGVGEATLSPSAYAIITDYFPPHKLTRALSAYQTGIYVGTGLSMILGSIVIANVPAIEMPFYGRMEPWQVVFIMVGLPGLLVAALMYTIKEPQRRGMLVQGTASNSIPIRDAVTFILKRRMAYGLLIGAVAAKSMAFYGVIAWIPAYFMRVHSWEVAQVGLWYGLASIIFGILGINSGGYFAQWLRTRGYTDSNPRVGLIALTCLSPIGIAAPLMSSPVVSLALYCGFIFFASFPVGSQAAALQEITPNQLRAQVSAIYLFLSNICGIALGPLVIAFFTDIVFEGDLYVNLSMATVSGITCPLGALLFWLSLKPYRACFESAARGYK